MVWASQNYLITFSLVNIILFFITFTLKFCEENRVLWCLILSYGRFKIDIWNQKTLYKSIVKVTKTAHFGPSLL